MSSLVAEFLQNSGKMAKEDIVLKVDDFKRRLQNIKFGVSTDLKKLYADFSVKEEKLDKFISDADDISIEYTELCSVIEKEIKPQMMTSVVEFNDLVEDLKNIKKLLEVLQCLCNLHKHLTGAQHSATQLKYLDAVCHLLDFENIMTTIDKPCQTDISVISYLNIESRVTKEDITFHLTNLWQKVVSISTISNERNQKLTINFNKEGKNEGDILLALYLLKQLNQVLKDFGKQFLSTVCEFALLKTVSVKESPESFIIRVVNENRPKPDEAFDVLKKCLSFLHNALFCFSVNSGAESLTAMNEFGKVIGDDFCSAIIEKCLKVAIPTQSKQLEMFHNDINAAEEFCKFLVDIGFVKSDNQLLNFIHDVDILPVNKMAQDLMRKARSLMQKGLHQTITIDGQQSVPSHNLKDVSKSPNGLSKDTFMFPKCQISVSVKQLVKLLMDVKEEANNIVSSHSAKLFYVSRDICELYCCVVPTYHKEEIEKIPQQTAIFHNNCMYLAHHLTLLGPQYANDLQPNVPMTFIDLVPEIKRLGTEMFLAQMRLQKQQLLQLLQEEQVCGGVFVDDGTANKAEKAVRQCLCQLQLLKNVWSDVLPLAVYFKAIGTLFNSCLEEIILRITSMEDIAADAAAQYDNVFTIVVKQGPELFKVNSVDNRDQVHQFVRHWFKFQELQLILSASMREIVDRWASGKGPLSSHFTSEEVKHLIRAIFQNTERRAAALAKIR